MPSVWNWAVSSAAVSGFASPLARSSDHRRSSELNGVVAIRCTTYARSPTTATMSSMPRMRTVPAARSRPAGSTWRSTPLAVTPTGPGEDAGSEAIFTLVTRVRASRSYTAARSNVRMAAKRPLTASPRPPAPSRTGGAPSAGRSSSVSRLSRSWLVTTSPAPACSIAIGPIEVPPPSLPPTTS